MISITIRESDLRGETIPAGMKARRNFLSHSELFVIYLKNFYFLAVRLRHSFGTCHPKKSQCLILWKIAPVIHFKNS